MAVDNVDNSAFPPGQYPALTSDYMEKMSYYNQSNCPTELVFHHVFVFVSSLWMIFFLQLNQFLLRDFQLCQGRREQLPRTGQH